MSNGDRVGIMERMVEFCGEHGLNEVYGIVEKKSGRYRSLTFCKARILDGEIRIYSPNFIQVYWQTAIRALPQKDALVFTSEADALQFMKAAFVDYDYEAAYSVPTKAPPA